LEKIEEIFEKNDFAVLVGGSMMYEKAVAEGLNDLPTANAENQQKLEKIWKEEGLEKLQEILKSLDEEYYEIVHKENPRRLLRAIDVIWQTGKKFSELTAIPTEKRNFKLHRIGIKAPREIIYERINQRVDKMLENGLLEEVKTLVQYKDLVPLQTVGYTEIFKYLEGTWDLDFAIEEIKKNSRRYAKRQETWNKKVENVTWLNYDYSEEDLEEIFKNI
jgi:tRNA dimethylallyltransferase